jgi:hypothetical protein
MQVSPAKFVEPEDLSPKRLLVDPYQQADAVLIRIESNQDSRREAIKNAELMLKDFVSREPLLV